MEWYEVVLIIIIIPLGLYINGKISAARKANKFNDSWRTRNEKERY